MLKHHDKVLFDVDGKTRLGIVIERNGQPFIYNIDSEEETIAYRPNLVQNIRAAGKVTPIGREEIARFVQILVNSGVQGARLDDEALCEWLAQCPKIAFTAFDDGKFICVPVEQPVTYTRIGSMFLDGEPCMDRHKYDICRCSNGKIWIRDNNTQEMAMLDKDTLFQYFQHKQ